MELHPGLGRHHRAGGRRLRHVGRRRHVRSSPCWPRPSIILFAEQAIWAALYGRLDEGTSAVEHRVEISHLAPTPVGAKVRAEAVLEAIDGRRLVFRISVTDDRGLVAAGRFTRVIVSKQRFMERAGEG